MVRLLPGVSVGAIDEIRCRMQGGKRTGYGQAYGKAHCVGKTKERGFYTGKGESRKRDNEAVLKYDSCQRRYPGMAELGKHRGRVTRHLELGAPVAQGTSASVSARLQCTLRIL
jgi:hypothetical protein